MQILKILANGTVAPRVLPVQLSKNRTTTSPCAAEFWGSQCTEKLELKLDGLHRTASNVQDKKKHSKGKSRSVQRA
jgi:hypothetical protein